MAASDAVILLIGLHGSGKSTFTRAATGAEVRIGKSSHGIYETTVTCQAYEIHYKGKCFTIVDTPGLADRNTHEENLKILDEIAQQLSRMGQPRINGIIYFHSIQNMRLSGVHKANFRLLQAICGQQFPHVVFVTSRWDRIRMEDEEHCEIMNHHLELERRKLFPRGPRIKKFLNDSRSHEAILDYFADRVDSTAEPATSPQLQFIEELRRFQFAKTGARALRKTGAVREIERERKRVSKGSSCSVM
ncbi:P-loop containing nucleoside triphosphate hydrolase protein [Immersiella caudata]|uniref:P-loop containing nucleoside triphosphate hydrolase protein n=1 Tax=Immersiella caudata TaxID=314043 RepID=A0AA40CBI7_9PEZI|nr:P-loop containing nucleoside triphosphate hydrolase protein [Immersiella caudata]